jgi:hypothetical protein
LHHATEANFVQQHGRITGQQIAVLALESLAVVK